ncbi:MAG TPA: T9SS type A sorting domain-containing protein, partial [Bacteroidia bacterium]
PMDKLVKSSNFFYNEMYYANTYSVLTLSKSGELINLLSDGFYKIDLNNYDQKEYLDQVLYPNVSSTVEMNLNDLEASIQNNGFMYSDKNRQSNFNFMPALKLKSEPCNNIAFSHGIWIGAKNNNDSSIKVSRSTYESDSNEYAPGPINVITGNFDSTLTVDYNRFWKIKRYEVEDFKLNRNNSGYIIPKNILDWPGNGNSKTITKMAPYVDTDNDQKYDPTKGDYPDMKGDMMFWWVFNDNVAHRAGRNLKFQINASCYAYHDKNLTPSDSNFLINRTLLFDYEFINCSGQNQKEVIIGLFNDEDIGNYSDDAVSFDSASSTVFAYNGDDYDDLYINKGFGFNPPILSTQFLNQNLFKFVRQSGGMPLFNDPTFSYNLMIAKGDEGKPYNQTQMSLFNHTPCESDTDFYIPTDIRYLMSLKAGDLAPLASYKLTFANYIQYNSSINYLNQDCNKTLLNANKIKQWYINGNFPSDPVWPLNVNDIKTAGNDFKVYPNPTSQILNFDWADQTQYEIKVYDLNGKLCLNTQLTENNQSIDVSQLVSGVYFIMAISDSGLVSSKFVKN